jgi:O-antigen/teichoic acid export membrane protein
VISAFARDIMISLGSAGLARVVTFASMACITRIYEPDAYGTWVVLLALASFFIPFATLRYDIALVIAPTRRISAGLLMAVAFVTVTIAAVVLVGVLTAPGWLLESFTGLEPAQRGMLVLAPIVVVLLAGQTVLQSWLTRERQFGALSKALLVQSIVTAAATILLPFALGANAEAAAAGAVGGILATVFFLAWCTHPSLLEAASKRRLDVAARHGLRRYKAYPLYTVPYSVSAVLSERVLQLVLAGSYSLAVLGAFFVARQVVTAPAGLLSQALRQVVFAYGAQLDERAQTREKVNRILALLVDALAPALAFGVVWLKPIIVVALGDKWPNLAEFAWWIMFVAATSVLSSWLDRVLDVLGRPQVGVALQVSSDIVLVGVVLSGSHLGLSAVALVGTLSIVGALTNLVWLFVVLRLLGSMWHEIGSLLIRLAAWTIILSLIHYGISTTSSGMTAIAAGLIVLVASLAPVAWKSVALLRIPTAPALTSAA